MKSLSVLLFLASFGTATARAELPPLEIDQAIIHLDHGHKINAVVGGSFKSRGQLILLKDDREVGTIPIFFSTLSGGASVGVLTADTESRASIHVRGLNGKRPLDLMGTYYGYGGGVGFAIGYPDFGTAGGGEMGATLSKDGITLEWDQKALPIFFALDLNLGVGWLSYDSEKDSAELQALLSRRILVPYEQRKSGGARVTSRLYCRAETGAAIEAVSWNGNPPVANVFPAQGSPEYGLTAEVWAPQSDDGLPRELNIGSPYWVQSGTRIKMKIDLAGVTEGPGQLTWIDGKGAKILNGARASCTFTAADGLNPERALKAFLRR